jgi:hypothetical protein
MRRAAKIDANQPDIVKALVQAGCSVRSLAAVGQGFPDLIVGRQGWNYLLEVKDGTLSPSKRALTEDEAEFHASWRGNVFIVNTVAEALEAVGL